MVAKKPPLPPPKVKSSLKSLPQHIQWKSDDESTQHIQKLAAVNEKSNLEISDLRKQLHHERCAVRELR
jgi:hypothetical protein